MARLVSRLLEIADASDEIAEEALRETAKDIVSIAKQLSPVDTGALKESIRAESVGTQKVRIGSSQEYAGYVEYGTVNSPAQPYLTPAFVQAVPTFKKRLKDAIEKRS